MTEPLRRHLLPSTANAPSRNKKERNKKLQVEASVCYISRLPVHILIPILCKLPIAMLLKECRYVCKLWRDVLLDPDFTNHHLSLKGPSSLFLGMKERALYCLEFEGDSCHFSFAAEFIKKYEFVNSCNGLLYFYDYKSSNLDSHSAYVMFILNPFTGEYLCLPPCTEGTVSETNVCGLGFCPKTNQFKAIRMYYVTDDPLHLYLQAEVYTLGTGTWRSIGVVSDLCSDLYLAFPAYSKVYVNGKFHWFFRYVFGLKLYTFDFESEQFGSMPLPPDVIDNDNYCIADFGVLGETIYLCGYNPNIEPSHSEEIWVMKQYGVAESWTKMSFIENKVKLQNQFNFSTITFFDNKDSLLLCDGNRFYYDYIDDSYDRFLRRERVVVHEPRFTSLQNDAKGESSKVLNAGCRHLSGRM